MPPPGTDTGPFLSALDWLEGLGEVPLNVFRGNLPAAGRKLADTILDIPDAFVPGDWIPQVSEEGDDVTASEVVGVDRKAHPGIAKAVDIIGGTAVNPATWAGRGLPLNRAVSAGAGKVADVAKRGYEMLPEPIQAIGNTSAANVRRSLNWLNVPAEEEALLRQAGAAGNQSARAAIEEAQRIYSGLSSVEREAVGEIAHGINRAGTTDRTKWTVLNDPEAYLASRTDLSPASKQAIDQAVKDRTKLMQVLAEGGGEENVLVGKTKQKPGYIRRQFSGQYFEEGSPLQVRNAKEADALRKVAAEVEGPEGLLDFLQKQNVDLEFDALKADLGRAAQQGKLVERGRLGQEVLNRAGVKLYDTEGQQDVATYGPKAVAARGAAKEIPFELSNPQHAQAMRDTIKEIAKQPGMSDYAYKLDQAFNGMPPRSQNWFAQGLHQGNKLFKGAATYGLLLPRVAFNVRNRISGLWQALSNPEARKTLPGNAKRFFSDLFGAVDDGFMKLTGSTSRSWGKTKLTAALDTIDDAFKNSRGDVKALRAQLAKAEDGKYLLEALDNGILNNFVDSEQLLGRMLKDPKWARAQDFMDWPAEIAQGLEQRMRLGTFLDLRKNNIAKNGAEAGQTIRDTFLDYDVVGHHNRTFREIFPFGSFLSQNVKQQSKFLAEQPGVAVAAAQVFGEDEGLPKYPWLDEQLTLPVGLDEKGQPQYASGFGLPIEGLTAVPGFGGRDIFRDVVGSMQPLLKTGISYAADRDPLTGGGFGQYDKILGESQGAAGRAYNILKGTGIPQAVTGPFGQVENLLDPRKSATERALQATTGLKFTSVDPDLAERQRIEDYLRAQPNVRSMETLYQTDQTPETKAMLQQLREAKARLKEKRQAAAAL